MRRHYLGNIPPSVFSSILGIFLHFTTMLNAQPCCEIVGYYPAWKWYARQQMVSPQTIKYDRYSVINYAFFKPLPDGSLTGTDDWADENLLLGKINWETTPKSHYPNTSIVDLAHKAGVKILISIGGWSESDLFPKIAADAQKRQKFASECTRLVVFYNLDGIDIDWEYPGYDEHKGTPADKQNFTFLLRGVRDSLSALTQQTGINYLLTGAFGASPDQMENIEWNNVAPLMDAINLMTYDFYGSFSAETGHHAALYASSAKVANANTDAAARHLTEKYGVSPSKINIGLAFYGQSMKTKITPSLNTQTLNKSDEKTFKNGTNYHEIVARIKDNTFTEHWDDAAQASYLTGNNGLNTFVTYENTRSISAKAQYVLDKSLRGVIIWELTGDYLPPNGQNVIASNVATEGGISTPLADAVHTVFCTSTPHNLNSFEKKAIVSVEMTTHRQKKLSDTSLENPNGYVELRANSLVENADRNSQFFEDKSLLSTDVVNDFQVFTDENDFLILKFHMKKGMKACLKLLSENGTIQRDIDLGEIDEGFYEHWALTHKDLPSGKYKVWIDDCKTAFQPNLFYREWIKL
jgi:GH18 family chitinase